MRRETLTIIKSANTSQILQVFYDKFGMCNNVNIYKIKKNAYWILFTGKL